MWNIVDPFFWFDITPVRMGFWFSIFFLVVFSLLFFSAIILRIVRKRGSFDKPLRRFFDHVSSRAFFWSIFGFVWLFLTFEEIVFFGARFWMLFWAFGAGYAAYRLYMQATREIPEERLRRAMTVSQKTYLPRRAR